MKKRNILVGLILVLLFLVGCGGDRERVMVPPRADLQGAKRIAILPLENITSDPGLSIDVQRQLFQDLQGYYQIISDDEVNSALQRIGYRRGSIITLEDIQKLSYLLRVDAVIVGEIERYFEDVAGITPRISSTYMDKDVQKARWAGGQNTSVIIELSLRVMHGEKGWNLYSKRVRGHHESTSRESINWYSMDPPPASIIPQPNRRDVPDTRMRAMRQAVNSFTADLLPTYVWQRVD